MHQVGASATGTSRSGSSSACWGAADLHLRWRWRHIDHADYVRFLHTTDDRHRPHRIELTLAEGSPSICAPQRSAS